MLDTGASALVTAVTTRLLLRVSLVKLESLAFPEKGAPR